MKKIKAVLFDMGGTLIDYTPPESFLVSCRAYGRRNNIKWLSEEVFDKIEMKEYKAREDAKFWRREFSLWKVFSSELAIICRKIGEFEKLMEDFYRYYSVNCGGAEIYQDALPTLSQLKEMNLYIGLVSNTCFPSKMHLWDLERFGLLRFFSHTLFSIDIGYRKPSIEIYCRALENNHIEPNETIFIGDQLDKDVYGPLSLGMGGILIDRFNSVDYQALLGTAEYSVINTLEILPKILEKI
jgi:HAD superfamily hydrolase (TIGR01549 family)